LSWANPTRDAKKKDQDYNPLRTRNAILEGGDWLKNVIWDSTKVDPVLIGAEEEDAVQIKPVTLDEGPEEPKTTTNLDPFNISNDHLYEHTREARNRIRQTFGSIEVVHSLPARTLQMPFVSLATC
jgi:hypothetical protein